MKVTKLFFLLLLTNIFLIVSCSSDDSGNVVDDGPAAGELVAEVDGTSFSSRGIRVGAVVIDGFLSLTAIKTGSSETITINVSNISVGNFNLGPGSSGLNGASYLTNDNLPYLSAVEGGSGQLRITKLDGENGLISGTFSFVAQRFRLDDNDQLVTESVTVSAGEFNDIPLTTDVLGGNSELSANIDGAALNANTVQAVQIVVLNSSTITVTATNNITGQDITLIFPGDAEPGAYKLGGLFNDFQASYSPGGPVIGEYTPTDGILNIDEIDLQAGTASGQFEFMATRVLPTDPDVTYNITNGTFSVEF